MPRFDGLDGSGLRVAVVAARFNEAISGSLLKWCREGLGRHGVADHDVLVEWVPGAFELPLAAKALAGTGEYDAVVCLGAVIRGDTAHFDFVAGEAARGIQQVALDAGTPVMFGVLTTDSIEQAEERSRDDESNKGFEVAEGAIHMARLMQRVSAATEATQTGDG